MSSTIVTYLMLFSFATGNLNYFGYNKIEAINMSPYNGVAVSLIAAHDGITEEFEPDKYINALKLIKQKSAKDIWPTVYFNRFTGFGNHLPRWTPLNKIGDFVERINGLDIKNKACALEDFFKIWEYSLKVSKSLNSPGIVVDPELYNDRDMYNIHKVSKKIGISSREVKKRLLEIGGRLVDSVDKIYPKAVIWFLFTRLATKPGNTEALIVKGMLDQALKMNYQCIIVSGGEQVIRYCSNSINHLEDKIKRRNILYRPYLQKYPNLRLGGTISPWHVFTGKGPKECQKASMKNLDDFLPLVELLLDSYNYVWIYGDKSYAGYNPYKKSIANLYNKMLNIAIKNALYKRHGKKLSDK